MRPLEGLSASCPSQSPHRGAAGTRVFRLCLTSRSIRSRKTPLKSRAFSTAHKTGHSHTALLSPTALHYALKDAHPCASSPSFCSLSPPSPRTPGIPPTASRSPTLRQTAFSLLCSSLAITLTLRCCTDSRRNLTSASVQGVDTEE